MGIKLGSSSARIGKAVTNLKRIERSRLRVAPVLDRTVQSGSQLVFNDLNSEEELDFLGLNQLCGDVAEGLSDGEGSDVRFTGHPQEEKIKPEKEIESKQECF